MAEPTEEEITRLLSAEDRAKRNSDFVDTVVMDASLVEGTRYKFVLTNAPDPR